MLVSTAGNLSATHGQLAFFPLIAHALYRYFVCLQTTHQTAHGQLLDLTTSPPGSQDLSKFTINNYMRIVTFKTAYYSFYLPVACGMLLSGITKPEAFQTAKDILLVMGQYFQVLLMHICSAVCAHCAPHPYISPPIPWPFLPKGIPLPLWRFLAALQDQNCHSYPSGH